MKNERIVANSNASPFKSLGFPVGTSVRMAKSDFRRRQLSNKIFYTLIAMALIAMFALAGTAANAQSSLTGENAKEMARLLAVPKNNVPIHYSNRTLPRIASSTFDRFLMWNEITLDTTAIDHTPVDPSSGEDPRRFGEQLGPPRAARALAIVHIAMFDAVNAISKKFVSYTGIPSVSGDVSMDRAITQAAHDTLVILYPFQKDRLDALFDLDIVTIPGSAASINAGAALGLQAAAAILALRQNDGSQLPEPTVRAACSPGDDTCLPANTAPGLWQTDPVSGLKVALGGNWPKVKPFVMTSASQFRAPVPPTLTSAAYKHAFNEVFRFGGDPAFGTNTQRTERQTFIAKFWSYDGTPGLCAPTRHYNMIAREIALQQKMLTVPDIARLFALVNTALADAGLASWESKYFFQYWRPVTGIRTAVLPLPAVPNWHPLGAQATNTAGPDFTPPFPTYTSGHGAFGGALFQILRKFWPDATPFTDISDEWNGKNKDDEGNIRPLRPETFGSFSQAESENAQSRVYMGIHWQSDADVGTKQGNAVADFVFAHAFRPVP